MKILDVKSAVFPEVKVIKFARFPDERGYFAETYRRSDMDKHADLEGIRGKDFTQANVSYSKRDVIRGLHFQWNPKMDKLIKTIKGSMIDLFMDIRRGSPTYGKIGAYELSSNIDQDFNQWIWIPAGFAHGSFFLEETIIEYFCTGEWNPQCEASISPFAKDVDWSLCDSSIKSKFDQLQERGGVISPKDRDGYSVEQWTKNPNSENFIF